MKKIIALLLSAVLLFSFASCGTTTDNGETKANGETGEIEKVDAGNIKFGVILIGDENEGYTYAHIKGIKDAAAKLGVEESKIVWKYTVGENEKCYEAICDLVAEECNVIFSNSYGHQSFMVQAASEFPEVTFCAGTGDTAAVCGLPNVKNYFTAVYESRYVSGVVAGLKLKELMDEGKITEPKLGYVGAYPYAEVKSGFTAFYLGAKSIVPEVTMEVEYTNSWFNMIAEAETANTLMSRGCVIIGQHADSTGAPSAVQAEHEKGKEVYSVGYNIDMLSVAPDAALTSATNNWSVYYEYAMSAALSGEEISTDWCRGYAEDAVAITTLGKACAEGTEEKVAEVIEALKAGTLHVFNTETFTVGGEKLSTSTFDSSIIDFATGAVVYEGKQYEAIDGGYFHESEFRSAPYFSAVIDGITANE
ncbi:MAG: BMP family ABC transporter substrate-binding protein [Clostridia bacterium]|nr:BMP family ABC transporter substrate-binding protein [Clostridia bacterium]